MNKFNNPGGYGSTTNNVTIISGITGLAAALNERLSKIDSSDQAIVSNLDAGDKKITTTYVPTSDEDLVNKLFHDTSITPLNTKTQYITAVADVTTIAGDIRTSSVPSDGDDLTNKDYVDGQITTSITAIPSVENLTFQNMATTGPTVGVESVAYLPDRNLWVATGDSMLTSSDGGDTWVERVANDKNYQNVIYANGLFIAVTVTPDNPYSGQIKTSLDGVTWSTRLTGFNSGLKAVVYCEGFGYLAAGGKMSGTQTYLYAYSTTGISWTVVGCPDNAFYQGLATNGTIVVGVSGNDAARWTAGNTLIKATTVPAGNWDDVCYDPINSVFVAVSGVAIDTNRIMTSTDGVTWTTRSCNIPGALTEVKYNESLGLIIAVGTDVIMTNDDAINNNWVSYAATASLSGNIIAVGCDDKKNMLVLSDASSSNIVRSEFSVVVNNNYVHLVTKDNISSNVITSTGSDTIKAYYTYESDVSGQDYWTDIAWSPTLEIFVQVAYNGSFRTRYSYDGVVWTNQTGTANDWQSVHWDPYTARFIALASSGSQRIMYSTNGTSWSLVTKSGDYNSVCGTDNNSLIIVGDNTIMRSTNNGVSWSTITSPANNDWRDVCYSQELDLLVAVSLEGTVMYSDDDGLTWSLVSAPYAGWNSVCWSADRNLFVAVSASPAFMTSPDGVYWTKQSTPADASITCSSVIFELGYFIASGGLTDMHVFISSDGVSWKQHTAPSNSGSWGQITYCDKLNKVVCLSETGSLTFIELAQPSAKEYVDKTLANRPKCKLVKSNWQTISTGATNTITYSSMDFANDMSYSTGSGTITVPTAGVYAMGYECGVNVGSGTLDGYVKIWIDGLSGRFLALSMMEDPPKTYHSFSGSTIQYLDANEVLSVQLTNTTGCVIGSPHYNTTSTAYQGDFWVYKLG